MAFKESCNSIQFGYFISWKHFQKDEISVFHVLNLHSDMWNVFIMYFFLFFITENKMSQISQFIFKVYTHPVSLNKA